MKTNHTLVIIFNAFHDDVSHRYKEIVSDANTGEFIEERELKRKPRAARFDEVYENGSGDHDQWSEHKATRLRSHPLVKKPITY